MNHPRIPARTEQEQHRATAVKAAYRQFRDITDAELLRAGRFPGDAAAHVRDAAAAITGVGGRVGDLVAQAARHAANPALPAAGKRDLISAAADGIRANADSLVDAEASIRAARAQLTAQALPPVPRDAETTTRADARMILDAASSRDLPGRLRELAARDDNVGRLIASPWGADYVASRGEKPGSHDAARDAAIEAASRSSDPARAAAADALGRLPHLEGAVLAAHRMTDHAIQTDLAHIAGAVRGE